MLLCCLAACALATDREVRGLETRLHSLFKSLNEAYEERRSTSLKLREELREQDDKRLKAVVDRQKSRLASHEATLETKAAQHEARASYDAQRRQKLHEAAVAHKASEEQRRREKNLLAGSASLARLAGDKEAQQVRRRPAPPAPSSLSSLARTPGCFGWLRVASSGYRRRRRPYMPRERALDRPDGRRPTDTRALPAVVRLITSDSF